MTAGERALRVLVAPDSFKGSAGAAEAARWLAEGWAAVRRHDEMRELPLADGGEGTLDTVAAVVPGARRMPVTVPGPHGSPAHAYWLLLPDGTGVVELASTSGLTLLDRPRPATAHTLGFGRAIAAALDAGVPRLLLALGGSASTDGGAGVLTALGARLLDEAGNPVPQGNRGLAQLRTIDCTGLRPLPRAGVTVLSDVTNPLLGPTGAAAVFGPQKGFSPVDLPAAERNLRRLADRLDADAAAPGAGAAGGTAFGLLAWGAQLAWGSEFVGALAGLPAAVAGADVVVTGEGRFDTQSRSGKLAGHVSALAAAARVPALVVAGRIAAPITGLFQAAEDLSELAGDQARATADPARYLRRAGERLARRMPAH
ncbi:glycerate kinase [Amycolatopsis echigonensis]|uniref:Glycerate kinase n=1 Tax=Amycolatopsis echigonensis TaxID=2576905 RepID=A0A2N3WSV2_9PSEU|nr:MULTISPECIES: glycerate kinase [Amycolatopsis]MBB2498777.1 glycerate kinase [Amycolatopsis echigonensis]PKV96936.1 glycerate kinase [Amycolatopsis niigatensis]